MLVFNGTVNVRIVEASDLKPTLWRTRFSSVTSQKGSQLLDPYCNVDVDEYLIYTTTTKTRTYNPRWNEQVSTVVHDGQSIGFSVFHDCAIPPDDFVANCRIMFEELVSDLNDIWVSF
ncbi:unnamed protein product [Soboliphyme baturini]|uniref:C2 domain-containing protein n=1 Tax=Soboliphyme baturini TaxID=241478 RepID=A0A183ILZ6_9BILA|nr:unnamed protein product [Soboliphyme baturini]